MRKLVFSALAIGLMQASTACIIASDDDDGGDVSDGTDVTDGGIPAGCEGVVDGGVCFSVLVECPADADTYIVYSVDTTTGMGFSDEIACGTLGAILLDAGTYDMRVEAHTADGFVYGYEALENQTGADGDVVEVDFTPSAGEGFFWLTWDITDGGAPLTCDEAAAAGVSVLSTLVGPNTGTDDILKCHYFGWQTGGLPLGEYEVSVSVINDNDEAIAVANPVAANLVEDSELFDLGDFVFDIGAAQ